MKIAWLRRPFPRSLYGRAALILIVPIVTIQLVVSVVFIQRHFEGVTRQMTASIFLGVNYLREQVDQADTLSAARGAIARLPSPLGLNVTLPSDAVAVDRHARFDLSGGYVIDAFRGGLSGVLGVDLSGERGKVLLLVETRHGPMQIRIERRRVSASNPHQLLVLMLVTSALMTVIAYAFLRNQLRPIARLAEAAEAFGKGRSVPYRPRGANEVRAAGGAFLDMRNRIERQIEQRTLLLSGVSHDLRTPLTRLKLALAMQPEGEDTALMQRDVQDMQHLLDEFLAFARGDALDDAVSTDPQRLLAAVIDSARRAGRDASPGKISGSGEVMLRPMAVARALDNLIGNAVRYGTRAVVGMALTERALVFSVEDNGPGIPEARRDEAMVPFTRLDPARNQNKGSGVGLGLSIALDIARTHGGTLRLGQSDALGGLKAELILAR